MNEETPCPQRTDEMHCSCWYDGDECCACGEPEMTKESRDMLGMLQPFKPNARDREYMELRAHLERQIFKAFS